MKYVFFSFAVLFICGCVLPTVVSPFELYSEAVFGGNSRALQNPIEYIGDLLCCFEPGYDDAVGCSFAQDSENNNNNNYPLDPYVEEHTYTYMVLDVILIAVFCCLCAAVVWLVFRGLAKMIKRKKRVG